MILILGRFQPLHKGHMKLFRETYRKDRDLVIAVGSAGKSHLENNPLTGDERKEMLERALKAGGMAARIVLVPDRPSDEGYVEHVEEQLGARPGRVVTENPWTIELFTKAGYDVDVTDRHFELSSTDIRRRIACGDEWRHLVPEEVAGFLEERGIVDRIKGLSGRGEDREEEG